MMMTAKAIIHAGQFHSVWLDQALKYLPTDVYNDIKNRVIIVSNPERAGCRIPRSVCDKKEIVVISELLYPEYGKDENSLSARYLIFVVLHEIAHAKLNHLSPVYDGLSKEDNDRQEMAASKMAYSWFNEAANKRGLKEISQEEVAAGEKNACLRAKRYYKTA